MASLDDIKSQVNLRAYVAGLLSRGQHNYSYDQYSCFMHEDRTPSLTIYNDHWYCYSCGKGGSILDFVMEYEKCSLKEAADKLEGKLPLERKEPQTPPKEEKRRAIPMSRVEDNFRFIERGLPYFEQRQIKDRTAYENRLGVHPAFTSYYKMLEDDEAIEFRSERFAIPNLFDGKVRAINYRRNDSAFLHAFNRHPDKVKVMNDLEARLWQEPSEQDILDLCGGAKYRQEPGSTWKPFNVGIIKKREGKEIVDIPRRYLLMHAETKEFDTLALCDHGFPTIGVRLTTELAPILPLLFENIPLLYIIRDNDQPGLEKAMALQSCLGRGRIIAPHGDYKDSGELIMDGYLSKWMNRYGLEPALGV